MNYNFNIDKEKINKDNIITTLKNNGICLINNYINNQDLQQFKKEIDFILNKHSKSYEFGKVCSLRDKKFIKKFEKTWNIFYEDDILKEICNDYIGEYHEFNKEIFITATAMCSSGFETQNFK